MLLVRELQQSSLFIGGGGGGGGAKNLLFLLNFGQILAIENL
jgi:hypothetical protein